MERPSAASLREAEIAAEQRQARLSVHLTCDRGGAPESQCAALGLAKTSVRRKCPGCTRWVTCRGPRIPGAFDAARLFRSMHTWPHYTSRIMGQNLRGGCVRARASLGEWACSLHWTSSLDLRVGDKPVGWGVIRFAKVCVCVCGCRALTRVAVPAGD